MENRQTMFGKDIIRDNRSAEEMIKEALAVSTNADVIVAAIGEGAESSGESASKSNIDIPEAQKRLLKALVATGKPVVLVLFNGRPITLNWENEYVPAFMLIESPEVNPNTELFAPDRDFDDIDEGF